MNQLPSRRWRTPLFILVFLPPPPPCHDSTRLGPRTCCRSSIITPCSTLDGGGPPLVRPLDPPGQTTYLPSYLVIRLVKSSSLRSERAKEQKSLSSRPVALPIALAQLPISGQLPSPTAHIAERPSRRPLECPSAVAPNSKARSSPLFVSGFPRHKRKHQARRWREAPRTSHSEPLLLQP